MLKRKMLDRLIHWKGKTGHLPLLVKGARQVGKTFLIERFANEHYDSVIKINFDEKPTYKTIFEQDLDVDTICKQILLKVPNAKIIPNSTLIFLDEIQHCPNARTALKFLSADKRFDIIASGSLLGINYKKIPSNPVGYIEEVEMFSLDFEEYLWAVGVEEASIADIKNYFEKTKPVPQAMHNKMLELFREYVVIGGMPKAVTTFLDSRNFKDVLGIQRGIMLGYSDDIVQYADGVEKTKAKACLLSIPKHLSKDYKKFRYSLVEKNGTFRKYGGSLMWLYDAGIINFCHNLSIPEFPFEGNSIEESFKVYMRDTGLLVSMLDDGAQEDIIEGNLGIYKGAIYENIIADIFTKQGKKLYYFEKNNSLEVDFFIRYNKKATAIEVKSGDNTKSKSLKSVTENYGVERGIRLSSKNIGDDGKILNLPIYMSVFL